MVLTFLILLYSYYACLIVLFDTVAFYSKDGSVFRNYVYSRISLSQSTRDVALQLVAYHFDAEVIFWLLSNMLKM